MDQQEHVVARGFNLLESLVVMVTIILLASVVIPVYLKWGEGEPERPVPKLTPEPDNGPRESADADSREPPVDRRPAD